MYVHIHTYSRFKNNAFTKTRYINFYLLKNDVRGLLQGIENFKCIL